MPGANWKNEDWWHDRSPAGWPTTVQLGMADGAGGAATMKATAPFGFRYQYLAGGVNTGSGWSTWNPDGSFVSLYVRESVAARIVPVAPPGGVFVTEPCAAQLSLEGDANIECTYVGTTSLAKGYGRVRLLTLSSR